jgi:anaerobic selenocysteine-containing dehydrogenase
VCGAGVGLSVFSLYASAGIDLAAGKYSRMARAQPRRTREHFERWVKSVCVLCSAGCGLDVGVRDGRIGFQKNGAATERDRERANEEPPIARHAVSA